MILVTKIKQRWHRSLFSKVILILTGTLCLPLALTVIYTVIPPVSTLMIGRLVTFQSVSRDWVPLEKISPSVVSAVLVAEDSRFCEHWGIDWSALGNVIEQVDEDGPVRGGSTITMQTVKNLYLWPSRSYVRKALEMPYSLITDFVLTKRRIMEIYLNIAEWGDGIYGVEAAAHHYFRKSAKSLSQREAALLAASLPNPVKRDPSRPSRYHSAYANSILGRMQRAAADGTCIK